MKTRFETDFIPDKILIGGVFINMYETLKDCEAMGFSVADLRDFLQAKNFPPHLIKIAETHYLLFFNKTPI